MQAVWSRWVLYYARVTKLSRHGNLRCTLVTAPRTSQFPSGQLPIIPFPLSSIPKWGFANADSGHAATACAATCLIAGSSSPHRLCSCGYSTSHASGRAPTSGWCFKQCLRVPAINVFGNFATYNVGRERWHLMLDRER